MSTERFWLVWSTVCELVGAVCVLVAVGVLVGFWPAVGLFGLVLVLVGWLGGE